MNIVYFIFFVFIVVLLILHHLLNKIDVLSKANKKIKDDIKVLYHRNDNVAGVAKANVDGVAILLQHIFDNCDDETKKKLQEQMLNLYKKHTE